MNGKRSSGLLLMTIGLYFAATHEGATAADQLPDRADFQGPAIVERANGVRFQASVIKLMRTAAQIRIGGRGTPCSLDGKEIRAIYVSGDTITYDQDRRAFVSQRNVAVLRESAKRRNVQFKNESPHTVLVSVSEIRNELGLVQTGLKKFSVPPGMTVDVGVCTSQMGGNYRLEGGIAIRPWLHTTANYSQNGDSAVIPITIEEVPPEISVTKLGVSQATGKGPKESVTYREESFFGDVSYRTRELPESTVYASTAVCKVRVANQSDRPARLSVKITANCTENFFGLFGIKKEATETIDLAAGEERTLSITVDTDNGAVSSFEIAEVVALSR